MYRLRWLLLMALVCVASVSITQAQDDGEPPYLYYYSRLLGGIIVERADGTDSRQIGADIIPSDLTGIGGPGWSPSGNYFAAYHVHYALYGIHANEPYLMDKHGNAVVEWLELVFGTISMHWSPDESDLLLIVGSHREGLPGLGSFVWLIDAPAGKLLAEIGVNLDREAPRLGEITWDFADQRVVFDITPNTFDGGYADYSRVTMHFDGTILREPISRESFRATELVWDNREDWTYGLAVSPSGTYETAGRFSPIMQNTKTGETINLPLHTQALVCNTYLWSADERHIISLSGTMRDGCADAVLGVTDNTGEFWRELGSCSWNSPPCVGWLPEQVDVNTLPLGSPTPVQLSEVRIEYDEYDPRLSVSTPLRLQCIDEQAIAHIVDSESNRTLYTLDLTCPYVGEGVPIIAAHHPTHDLLVIFEGYISVWMRRDEVYERLLRLNSHGYALEFTDDGEYLRALNRNGWKVYSVTDILAALTLAAAASP